MSVKSNAANVVGQESAASPAGRDPERDRLIRWFAPLDRVVVAFSGGVDSSVVLAAAARSGGDVLAVTADSPSVARWQLDLARQIAADLQVPHRVIATDEVQRPEYAANDSRRCFHCKQTLYQTIDQFCRQLACQHAVVVSGTNRDDLGDYRPGIEAGRRSGVRTPLAELGLGKQAVRRLARSFGLSNADLPASPCLSSRIAYGVAVTVERLQRIERAEDFLRSMGLGDLRVRLHDGELARVEVPAERIEWLANVQQRTAVTEKLLSLGFRYVTLDLQGLRSGSMNRQLVSIGQPASLGRSVAGTPPSQARGSRGAK